MHTLYIYNLQLNQHSAFGGWGDREAGPVWGNAAVDIDPGMLTKFVTYGIDPGSVTFLHNGVKIQVSLFLYHKHLWLKVLYC